MRCVPCPDAPEPFARMPIAFGPTDDEVRDTVVSVPPFLRTYSALADRDIPRKPVVAVNASDDVLRLREAAFDTLVDSVPVFAVNTPVPIAVAQKA